MNEVAFNLLYQWQLQKHDKNNNEIIKYNNEIMKIMNKIIMKIIMK